MSLKGQKHAHRTAGEWRTILDRFDQSGQSQLAFCADAGIAATTFQLWRRRLLADRKAPTQFVDVTPAKTTVPRWTIAIEFPDGTTARVHG